MSATRTNSFQKLLVLSCANLPQTACRSQGKDAAYFRRNIDFLQNKGKDVVIFDVESWQQWRDVFSLWLEVHYPQTSDLYEMQR